MRKFKIKKDDLVEVITGKDKGKTGVILKVLREKEKVLVQGINVAKCHKKPTQTSEGGIIQKELPIHISNVKLASE